MVALFVQSSSHSFVTVKLALGCTVVYTEAAGCSCEDVEDSWHPSQAACLPSGWAWLQGINISQATYVVKNSSIAQQEHCIREASKMPAAKHSRSIAEKFPRQQQHCTARALHHTTPQDNGSVAQQEHCIRQVSHNNSSVAQQEHSISEVS